MKIKEKIKNGSFWVSLISSVFLILGAFGIEIGGETAGEIINGICSALVMLGIITTPVGGKSFALEPQEHDVTDAEVVVSEELAATEKTENTNMQ